MKHFSKIFAVFIIGLLFNSCTSENNGFGINDWIGNWKASDAMELKKSTKFTPKAYQGTISSVLNSPNEVNINGSLFNMEAVSIKGTLSSDYNSVSFRYDSQNFSIYGSGKMSKKNEIVLTYTIDFGADIHTYTSTAIRM